jgi:hypothetical protein
MIRSAAALFFLLLASCAAKNSVSENSSSYAAPAAGAEASQSSVQKPMKFYFADLQILVQTNPLSKCDDVKRLSEGRSNEFSAEVNSDGKFVRKLGPKTVQYYALNVKLQKMGFDEAQYAFSVLDGVVPEWAPHGMRVRRRSGNFIDLYYLGNVFTLQLKQSQVYSFKAVEKRGNCDLEHDINIFAENSGFYLPVEDQSVSAAP